MRHVKKAFTACLHATRTGWQLSFSNHDCDALIQAVAVGASVGAAVVASVLDGTLEVLAGEVAGSVDSTMRSINRGSSRADDVMSIDDNRGSSRADDVMSRDVGGNGRATVDASVGELKGRQSGCIHLWMTSERCFSTS
jgi:hypothetical protein